MIPALSKQLALLLKLPPEPPAPYGEEQSLRVFRASPQFLKYQLIMWGIGQGFLLLLFLFVFTLFTVAASQQGGRAVALCLLAGFLALLLFAGQAAVTRFCVYLQYEMRWYKVTDRSLRIREGVWFVREMTMTFVNIQNMEVSQGPIQRWLGIADLKVQTAGGGGSVAAPGHGGNSQQLFNMHLGYFRGVDNAHEILELMQERLRRSRSAGLGDIDDDHHDHDGHAPHPQPVKGDSGSLVEASRGLLREARALRLTVCPDSSADNYNLSGSSPE